MSPVRFHQSHLLTTMVDDPASTYPCERVRVLGSLVNVKPHTMQDGATSFTLISRSGSNKGLLKWKVILVFKDANDNSKKSRMIDVICWNYEDFLPPHALSAESFAVATEAKRDALMCSVYGGLYEFDVKFKSNEYSDPVLTYQKGSKAEV